MDFPTSVHHLELSPEDRTELISAVPGNRKPRAPFRAIRREGGHDDRTARDDSTTQHIPIPIDLRTGEEVEHGSVVP